MSSEATQTLRAILSQSDLFAGLTDENFDELGAFWELRNYEAGTAIVRESELGDEFYTIGKGRVRIEAQNVPDGGAKFIITLPLDPERPFEPAPAGSVGRRAGA